MLQFAIRQLIFVPVTLLLVTAAAFFMLRLTGDPIELYLGINGTPEQAEILRHELGLDKPVILQFALFIGHVLTGDFGRSLQFQSPAMPVVMQRLGATIELMGAALAIALVAGVGLGLISARLRDRWPDFAISSLAVAGQSMPSFWLGILLVQLFALNLGLLPTSGRGGLDHLILPAITLAAFVTPNLILITRTSVLEATGEPFVTTARAKGIPGRWVLFRHVLPNASNPIISFFGLQLGRLVGGSVVTETVFAWPGIGRLMIGSVYQRDVPVVIACIFVVCIAIVLANLLVDLLLALLDPRIKLD
jgi:peptide/nickel transport system permease protein/glutathione transport system permease protein